MTIRSNFPLHLLFTDSVPILTISFFLLRSIIKTWKMSKTIHSTPPPPPVRLNSPRKPLSKPAETGYVFPPTPKLEKLIWTGPRGKNLSINNNPLFQIDTFKIIKGRLTSLPNAIKLRIFLTATTTDCPDINAWRRGNPLWLPLT